MSTDPTETEFQLTQPKSAAAWVKAKYHTIALPSGVEVEISIPNLPMLAKTGVIPNDLIQSAVGVMNGTEELTEELVREQAVFYNKLISIAVHAPKVSEEQVPELPYEDIELIVEIATRQRDVDALGRHIAGLHLSKEWVSFRKKLSGVAPVED